ncbi:HeH/LEM domain protein [compost metagenome]
MSNKTLKVKPWGDGQGDFVVINEADFDPDLHELLGETEKPGKAPGIDDIRAALTTRSIQFDAKAKKPELQKLLDDAITADESVTKLKAALTEKGIQFGDDASLEDLQKLLDGAA